MPLPVFALLGYLLGSIPFGLLLTRAAGLGDIRASAPAISAPPTCCAPATRASPPRRCCWTAEGRRRVLLAAWFGGPQAVLCGRPRRGLGHSFPVWLRFKGGKGVATGLGVLLAAAWPVGLVAGAIWLAMAGCHAQVLAWPR